MTASVINVIAPAVDIYRLFLEMSASADVESQSPGARPRGRCLDNFLTVSVIALFAMFVLAVGGAFLFAKHVEEQINGANAHSAATFSALHGISSTAYKMQNFAYLEATQGDLKAGVMPWEPVKYGAYPSIGSIYNFDKTIQSLELTESGVYFLYVQLNFTCTYECNPGWFTLSFYNQHNKKEFSCAVHLPDKNRPFSHTCWSVVTFPEKGSRILAKAEFQDKLEHWKLQFVNSGFGIFLIDGLPAAHGRT